MAVPPTVQTPPYRPSKPSTPLLPSLSTPFTVPCQFGIPTFLHVLKDLTLHPERNSSLILRADPLPLDTQSHGVSPSSGSNESETGAGNGELDEWIEGNGLEKVEEVRVRLMPKQPKRDGKLDQRVIFYRTPERVEHDHAPKVVDSEGGEADVEVKKERAVVVMIPLVKSVEDIPYYHPPVRQVVFSYESIDPADDLLSDKLDGLQVDGQSDEVKHQAEAPEVEEMPIQGRLTISYLPFESGPPTSTITPTHSSASEVTDLPTSGPLAGLRRTSLPRKRSPLAGPASSPSNGSTTPPKAVKKEDSVTIQLRLERTCLALLERVYKHGFGTMVGYKKRVNHDTVVKREPFQDLYLTLKERHRHLDSRAAKPGSTRVEDVKRHVFKGVNTSLPDPLSHFHSNLSEWGSQDVAIAAFLMLLWRDMYPSRPTTGEEGAEEWDTWGRPENGFIDLGCGNGLLVHILISEGYDGKGYELRSRRTWPLYPPRTQKALIESPLDPPSLFPDTLEEWSSSHWANKGACIIREGTFLIGNHADELTPWLPLLSLIPTTPVPHLSLPCCLHTWDAQFLQNAFKPPLHPYSPEGNFEAGLEAGQSRYKSYLMWLGWVGLQCGWLWETEPLRIPSTRGWGIVARRRWAASEEELETCRTWALEQVTGVRERGAFKVRIKEGKEH